jgi:hypothetical protein
MPIEDIDDLSNIQIIKHTSRTCGTNRCPTNIVFEL